MKIVKLLRSNNDSDWLIAKELIFEINDPLKLKTILEAINVEIHAPTVSFKKRNIFNTIYNAINEKLVKST